MTSLLLVLFVYVYSLRVDQPAARELRGLRLADGTGWIHLGSVPCRPGPTPQESWLPAGDEHELEAMVKSRLVGGRCRVALVGQAASRQEAFRAAQAVRSTLQARDLGEERFVLLAQRTPSSSGAAAPPTVQVYATAGVVGGR
jgi:hypothetical protein